MKYNDVTNIEIVFHNLETLNVPITAVRGTQLNRIGKSLEIRPQIGEMVTIEKICFEDGCLGIDRKWLETAKTNYDEFAANHSLEERIEKCKDIACLNITFKSDENGKQKSVEYYPVWTGESDTQNSSQTCEIIDDIFSINWEGNDE